MAKYQKYAEYKDSGVEWFVELPIDWKVSKLKQVVDQNRQITYGIVQAGPNVENGIPYIRPADMTDEKGIKSFDELLRTSEQIALSYDRSKIKTGDIVISIGPSFGKVMMTPANLDGANLTQGTARIAISSEHNSRYFFWVLRSTISFSQWESVIGGATFRALNLGPLADTYVGFPSYDEQVKIATFLDHETAKIDSLIAKQEKLIELLKEKRQAVISHAVTKGLNPDVAMKDSGVEWLGQVPEHWQLVPLKYLCTFSGGGTPTKDNLSYWTDGNIPWVSPKDMKTFWISETQDYITEKAVKESSTNIVEQTSLLMVVRSGILQRTIPIAINTVPVTMNQDMKALKFGKRVLVEYIANLIHGNTAQLLLEWSKEGATVESIEHEYLANSLIPVPSLKEQEEITQVIAKKMKVYAELTEKAELQITLLQERRTALISSAVTGKINVSNWQHPNEAKTELSL